MKKLLTLIFFSTAMISSHAMELSQEVFKSVTPEAYEHYRAIKEIRALFSCLDAQLAQQLAKRGKQYCPTILLPDFWPTTIDSQTEHGLFLQFENFKTIFLQTPWGKVMLKSNTPCSDFLMWDTMLKKFLHALDATLYKAGKPGAWAYVGSIYKINKIGNTTLPEPNYADKKNNLHYDDIMKVWQEFKAHSE